jgi:hypothetical protein
VVLEAGTSIAPNCDAAAMSKLGKRLRELAISKDGCKQLVQVLDELRAASVLTSVLEQGTTESGKTALHLAAWKGDIGCVATLVAFGADVNRYSMGPGNYGKTAIFYAITQCRDDVVQLLLEHGANVRIVNNKGQTPRSLSISHLSEDTVRLIEAAEAAQHAMEWQDFYSSHYSDRNTCFGDLDPRFHALGAELRAATADLAALPRTINETTFASRYENYKSYFKIPATTDYDAGSPVTPELQGLDDLVVSLLSTNATADVSGVSDRSVEHTASIALRKAADGSYVVESVVGRVHSIDTISPTHYVVRLRPVTTLAPVAYPSGSERFEAATFHGGGHWHVQCNTAGDIDQCGDSDGVACLTGGGHVTEVTLHVGSPDDAPGANKGVYSSLCADLRVGQLIYTTGRVLRKPEDVLSGESFEVAAERLVVFGTPPVTDSSSSNKSNKKVKKWDNPPEANDPHAGGLYPEAQKYVTLADIASSFSISHHAKGRDTAVPVVVVDSLAAVELLEQDVAKMVREIAQRQPAGAALGAAEEAEPPVGASTARVPHVVGMDCEWRPGFVFVPRSDAGSAVPPTGAPVDSVPQTEQLAAMTEAEEGGGGEDGEESGTGAESGEMQQQAGAEAEVAGRGDAPKDYPVAVLQLATRSGVYLVDLQQLTLRGDQVCWRLYLAARAP